MNRKEELKLEVRRHQESINQDVEYIKSTGKRIGLIALVAGGAFFLTYSIARGISAGRKDRVVKSMKENPEQAAFLQAKPVVKTGIGKKLGGLIMTEISLLLIGLAKNQITNYLSKLHVSNDEEDAE